MRSTAHSPAPSRPCDGAAFLFPRRAGPAASP
nr:MAG TPA: hypothetical protein [Caudoviricetes sp.]